jgi:hypothetical protein
LDRLWSALEDRATQVAVLAEWRHRLAQDFSAASSLLQPTDKDAWSYPDVNDACAHYKIVVHGEDDVVGVHCRDGSVIELTKADILLYRLDKRRLCRRVAAALGFRCSQAPFDETTEPVLMATYRPVAGYEFPVYIATPHEPVELRRAVEAGVARGETPVLILVPTRRQIRPDCESLLNARRAGLLVLDDAIAADASGKWGATPIATAALAAFQAEHLPTTGEVDRAVFFPTPAEAKWSDVRIRFVDGHTISVAVGGESRMLHYAQMGMADRRNAKPSKQWEFLRSLARSYGAMTWDSPDADRRNQKRRERLSRDLKSFFRIDGEPIVLTDDKKGWRTAFSIEPDA